MAGRSVERVSVELAHRLVHQGLVVAAAAVVAVGGPSRLYWND